MSDKPEFVYVTYISTTPEKLWSALLDGELTKLYWGVHKNVSDWQVGSRWTHQDYETGAVHVEGEVLEFAPPHRLKLTWKSSGAGGGGMGGDSPSQVTVVIEPFMGAVKLTLVHDHMERDSAMWKGVKSLRLFDDYGWILRKESREQACARFDRNDTFPIPAV